MIKTISIFFSIFFLGQIFAQLPHNYNKNDLNPIAFINTVEQSLNLFYTQNPKTTWVVEMQHQYEDEDPFYNPQLSVNPYQNSNTSNPNDPSSIFVNENSLNIEQSRFLKTNKFDAKLDYFYRLFVDLEKKYACNLDDMKRLEFEHKSELNEVIKFYNLFLIT